jgi:hypothetical protein
MRRGVATPRLSKPPPINERDDERRGNIHPCVSEE